MPVERCNEDIPWAPDWGAEGSEPELLFRCVAPPARLYTWVLPRFAATPARVANHALLPDMNPDVPVTIECCIEVVANGLSLHGF